MRTVTPVAPNLWVTGEPPLDGYELTALAWSKLGVEIVLDLTTTERGEMDLPVERVWLPLEDDGSRRPDWWFEEVCDAASGRPALVHCHMGVARAPSAAFAIMLNRGMDEYEALERLISTRRVATAPYSIEALEWFLGRAATPDRLAQFDDRRRSLVIEARRALEG